MLAHIFERKNWGFWNRWFDCTSSSWHGNRKYSNHRDRHCIPFSQGQDSTFKDKLYCMYYL